MRHNTRIQFPVRLSLGVAAVLLGAGCLAAVGPNAGRAQAASTTTVRVYPQVQYQTIQGWGTSLAWWAETTAGWSLANRNALADKLFDPVKGIGLNEVRPNRQLRGELPAWGCRALL